MGTETGIGVVGTPTIRATAGIVGMVLLGATAIIVAGGVETIVTVGTTNRKERKMKVFLLLLGLTLLGAGCAPGPYYYPYNPLHRGAVGAGVGAATGAVAGGVFGRPLEGMAAGAVVGGAAGALTTPPRGQRPYYDGRYYGKVDCDLPTGEERAACKRGIQNALQKQTGPVSEECRRFAHNQVKETGLCPDRKVAEDRYPYDVLVSACMNGFDQGCKSGWAARLAEIEKNAGNLAVGEGGGSRHGGSSGYDYRPPRRPYCRGRCW